MPERESKGKFKHVDKQANGWCALRNDGHIMEFYRQSCRLITLLGVFLLLKSIYHILEVSLIIVHVSFIAFLIVSRSLAV